MSASFSPYAFCSNNPISFVDPLIVSSVVSTINGANNVWRTSDKAEAAFSYTMTITEVTLFIAEASNPVGWIIGFAKLGADLYYEHKYGESLAEHFLNH